MDLKVLKWKLCEFFSRRLILKVLLLAVAILVISYMQIAHEVRTIEPLMWNLDDCPRSVRSNGYANFSGFFKPLSALAFPVLGSSWLIPCEESGNNLTVNVFKELMEKDLLDCDAKALCVGEGSGNAVLALRNLGISNAIGVNRHPFFSIFKKRFVYELDFKDKYFDFVFSRALDRVSVPALLVLEIERVLKPGGTGAMLVGTNSFYSRSLIRSATPVSSFLKSSDVVHVCGIGAFTLVIFKKRFDFVSSFGRYRLPEECHSVKNNEPFMKYIEPLVDEKSGQLETELSYLPNFMNISSRNRLIYMNVGAGGFVKSSAEKMFKPYYSIHPRDFNVFIVDHDTSVLSSYVKNPGIAFVYHPGLAGDKGSTSLHPDEYLNAPPSEKVFNFISWFKETIADGDFVVLMMNAGEMELKILLELFETGAICSVDELFLRCSDVDDCKGTTCGDCMKLVQVVRNSGVFAHQWFGD